MSNPELLMQLRLDQSQRDDKHHPISYSRWLWGAGIAGVVVLAGTVGGWMLLSPAAITAQPTTAVAASVSNPAGPTAPTGPAGAVLQATGYVTARRQATVPLQPRREQGGPARRDGRPGGRRDRPPRSGRRLAAGHARARPFDPRRPAAPPLGVRAADVAGECRPGDIAGVRRHIGVPLPRRFLAAHGRPGAH